MSCVYALFSSSNPEHIRYIGRSKYDSHNKRLKTHILGAKYGDKGHVYNWIRKTINSGDTVLGVTLESGISWKQTAHREMYYIRKYKKDGHDLTNMSNGGEGRGLGYKLSEEARNRISESNKVLKKAQHSRYKEKGLVWGKDLGPKPLISDEIVQLIFTRRAEGKSLRAIARELDSSGTKAAYGGNWTASSINYILKNKTTSQM